MGKTYTGLSDREVARKVAEQSTWKTFAQHVDSLGSRMLTTAPTVCDRFVRRKPDFCGNAGFVVYNNLYST